MEKNPRDLRSVFLLADLISRERGPDADVRYLELMDEILKVQPNNLLALSDRAGAALRSKNEAAFKDTIAGISAIAATLADKLKAALATTADGMRARLMANRYARAFTGGYTEVFEASQAIADIAIIEKLTAARSVALSVHRIDDDDVNHRLTQMTQPLKRRML